MKFSAAASICILPFLSSSALADLPFPLPRGYSQVATNPCVSRKPITYQNVKYDCQYRVPEINAASYIVYNNWNYSPRAGYKSLIVAIFLTDETKILGTIASANGTMVVYKKDGYATFLGLDLANASSPYQVYEVQLDEGGGDADLVRVVRKVNPNKKIRR